MQELTRNRQKHGRTEVRTQELTRKQRKSVKDKRIIFEREFMTEFDYQHDLYYSKEEGRKEGREEGKLEATQVVAKNMKSLGFDTKAICKCTSLTEDQVKAL